MKRLNELTIGTVLDLLKDTAYPQRDEATGEIISAGENAFLIGTAGIGKTQAIAALAKDTGYEMITLITSQMNAEQFQGIPRPTTITIQQGGKSVEVGAVEYLLDTWQAQVLANEKAGKPTMLFFDELRNAPSDVLAASLNILADRKINGVPLPDSTVIIAASNSAEDSVNPSPFQTPIQNRFSWYAVTQTPTGWAAGAMNKWGGKMSERERIIRPVIVKAIKEGRASLLEPPGDRGVEVRLDKVTGSSAETEEVVKHAWRSPRSWNRLIVQLASLRLDNRTESDWVNAATHVSNATVGVLGAGEISSELHRIAHRLYNKSTVFSTIQEAVEDATVTVKTKGNQVATQAHFIAAGGELFVNNIDAPYSFDIRSWRERVEDAGLTNSEAVNNHLADVVQGYKAAMKLKYGGFIKRLLSDGPETTQVLNGMIQAMEDHMERALMTLPRHTSRQEQLKDFDADARLIKALQATIKDFLNGR